MSKNGCGAESMACPIMTQSAASLHETASRVEELPGRTSAACPQAPPCSTAKKPCEEWSLVWKLPTATQLPGEPHDTELTAARPPVLPVFSPPTGWALPQCPAGVTAAPAAAVTPPASMPAAVAPVISTTARPRSDFSMSSPLHSPDARLPGEAETPLTRA